MQLLTNHIGYEMHGPKQAILMTRQASLPETTAVLLDAHTHQTVQQCPLHATGSVDNWHQGNFYQIDFSGITAPGQYYLRVGESRSAVFEIGHALLMQQTFSDVLHYFKSQRCSGIFDAQDKQVPLLGTSSTVDVHGGWYDASGDVSKYLSHLSYANYLNPQQIPMVVWNMLKGLELLNGQVDVAPFSRTRLIDEALFGADFLVRMQNPNGFFYMTVFDKWSKDIEQREICAYATQLGHKSDDFQAGFRQGGGVAVAALAAAARLDTHGEYRQTDYLERAERGYWHLKEHNLAYLNDGTENIIDEYCALLAAVELYRTTSDHRYLAQSREWAQRLAARQLSDARFHHFWSANHDGSRPYFHAAEAGLPVLALCEYLAIEDDRQYQQPIRQTVQQACQFEHTISEEVNNPFGYPRQYVKPVDGDKRSAFFVAHRNESGYWWQGENARLASLAVMALRAQPFLAAPLDQQMRSLAHNALNWIVGLNPYDMCMLDGHGRNNPDYLPAYGFYNAKGGLCNGITAGFDDEQDIAFNPPGQKDDLLQNWRLGEQWIPHGAWYLLAIISQLVDLNTPQQEQQA